MSPNIVWTIDWRAGRMQICGLVTELPGQLSVNLFFFFFEDRAKQNDIDIVTKLTIRRSNSLINYILEFLIEAN